MFQGTAEILRTHLCSHWSSSRGVVSHTAAVHGHESVPESSPCVLSSGGAAMPGKCSAEDTSVPWGRTFWGTWLGFSACIHLKYRLCTQQLLNPVYSQEPRSCYKFSLEEKMCCPRTTVLFLKILRKYFVLILALTGHQSDDTNLFYQEARQER